MGFQLFDILFGQKLSLESTAGEMLRFIQRAASYSDITPIILKTPAAVSLLKCSRQCYRQRGQSVCRPFPLRMSPSERQRPKLYPQALPTTYRLANFPKFVRLMFLVRCQ